MSENKKTLIFSIAAFVAVVVVFFMLTFMVNSCVKSISKTRAGQVIESKITYWLEDFPGSDDAK